MFNPTVSISKEMIYYIDMRNTHTVCEVHAITDALKQSEHCAIGLGRFKILEGGQGLEDWGGEGARGGPNSQQAYDVVTMSCVHKVFNKSVPNNYISHLKI